MSFQGCYTAIVTPFNKKGEVDYSALGRLIDFQAESGVDGIVPCGTTGEVPTLTHEEHKKILEFSVDRANGRVEVIAGTGFNATAKTVEMTRFAEKIGADGSLLVVPYYNKPSQEGLFRHFAKVAESTKLRLMLYNIPSRTGVNLAPETTARLFEFDPIVAIKEAGGDVNAVSQLRSLCEIAVLSGDDGLTVPMMSLGAVGVVSVVSNLVPMEMVSLTRAMSQGDLDEAMRLHYRLLPLFKTVFLETNPLGVKAALAMMGKIQEELRLPLCPMGSENKNRIQGVLKDLGLLERSIKTSDNKRK